MTEKNTINRRLISEDLDRLLKEAWSKVVEYASIGAEEASRISSAAKIRVDIETLRYRRGRLLKTLGERYFRSCGQDPDKGVDGTRETMRQILGLERDITDLESDLAQVRGKKQTTATHPDSAEHDDASEPTPPAFRTATRGRKRGEGRRPIGRRPSP